MKRLLVFMTLLALALAWVAPTTAAGTTITMPRITQENYNEGEDLPDDAELFYQWFEKGEDGNWIRRKRDDADKGNARLYVSGENSATVMLLSGRSMSSITLRSRIGANGK